MQIPHTTPYKFIKSEIKPTKINYNDNYQADLTIEELIKNIVIF